MSPSVSVRLLLSQSDERLVGYARAGHERAFEALVQRYRRQLLAYCRRLLLSDQRAEDALQQALLQAWVALRDGSQVSEPRAWLYRIVHNAAVQTLRVSRYDYCQLSESLSGAEAPEADLDRRIAVREALAGLAALPEMQREALLRTAVEGRTHQQAAADLGLSEPAVRGLVYRARASLRAATSAIVPPPLIGWALEAGTRGTPVLERVAGLSGAGGGSAGIAGLLLKGGAVAVTAGALAGGIVAKYARHLDEHGTPAVRAERTGARRPAGSATARPVDFTRLADATSATRPRPVSGGAAARTSRKTTARHERAYLGAVHRQTAPLSATSPEWTPPTRGDGRPRDDSMFERDGGHDSGGHERPNDNSRQGTGGGGENEERQSNGTTSEPRHGDGTGTGTGSKDGSTSTESPQARPGTSSSTNIRPSANASQARRKRGKANYTSANRTGKDSSARGGSGEQRKGGSGSSRTGRHEDRAGATESSQQPAG